MISVFVSAVFLVVLCPGQAWAIPAPMSPEQLLSASDVVALARVTHLRLPQGGSTFETTWWNAKDQIEPARAQMPTDVMQTIKASFLDRLPFLIADMFRFKHPARS